MRRSMLNNHAPPCPHFHPHASHGQDCLGSLGSRPAAPLHCTASIKLKTLDETQRAVVPTPTRSPVPIQLPASNLHNIVCTTTCTISPTSTPKPRPIPTRNAALKTGECPYHPTPTSGGHVPQPLALRPPAPLRPYATLQTLHARARRLDEHVPPLQPPTAPPRGS